MEFVDKAIRKKLENEEMLLEQIKNKNERLNAFPTKLTFETSRRCNLSCRFCYHFSNKYFEKQSTLNQEIMSKGLIKKVADEIFPTLQYYESTLLGDPFLSPHLKYEIELAKRYHVFFRPTTNGTTLSDKIIELIDGTVDWLKCSFDSHIRGIYNSIRIGAQYEDTVKKLKKFAKKREEMRPVPYFRIGAVLTDINIDHMPEFLKWCNDELGVDDVEFMGLNIPDEHMECLSIFDKSDRVNKKIEEIINVSLDKKIKTRLAFVHMSKNQNENKVNSDKCSKLRDNQQLIGFIPPRNFQKMSYIIQREENKWEIGDIGYVWANDMRRKDLCWELFTRPFIKPNGNVESCGNCNTFFFGNLNHTNFMQLWNCTLYRSIRKRMYNTSDVWPAICKNCICQNVNYNKETSDFRNRNFVKIKHEDEIDYKTDELKLPKFKNRLKRWIPPALLPIARKINRKYNF